MFSYTAEFYMCHKMQYKVQAALAIRGFTIHGLDNRTYQRKTSIFSLI